MKAVTNYVVQDVQADGYLIKTTMTDLTCEGEVADDVIFQTMSMMKGLTLIIKTDQNGKPVKLTNYDEVKKNYEANAKNWVDELAAESPEAFEQVTKEQVYSMMVNQLSEK